MSFEITPDKHWWTAQELADANLPGLPGTKRRINAHAKAHGWDRDPEVFRRRSGKGGGFEYHWTVLPVRARAALTVAAKDAPKTPEQPERSSAWEAYEASTDVQKAKAIEKLGVIHDVEQLEAGMPRREAVRQVAMLHGKSQSTIWSWFKAIQGVAHDDRLAYLVPQHGTAGRARAAIDPEFMHLIKSDWLRMSGPALTACYSRQIRVARQQGIPIASLSRVRRELQRTVHKATEVLARQGPEALKRMYPAQERDKTALHALEAVNGDFHKFDVFVRWPDEPKPVRPQMVAWQDIYSGRILSWRLDLTPNAQCVQLSFGEMVEQWGIPQHVLLDNGREFAAKTLTGGAPTRFRWKVKEDDVPGLMTSLGCEIHWATPYSGQSKPIERTFRDLCEYISKDPRCEGAYTGNSPTAQPENYGNRAVPLEEFLEIVAEGIELHNICADRRSEVAFGRSFAEVFDESYANAPIRKATAAQRRMWLLGAEGVTVNSKTGTIKFMGNVFFDPVLHEHLGQKVIARFDTQNLWDGLHIYTMQDRYIGHAACREKVGFFDIEQGRLQNRARAAWLKSEKEALRAMQLEDAAELGRRLDAVRPDPDDKPAPPDAKVVQLVPPSKRKRAASEEAQAAPDAAEVAQLAAAFQARRKSKEREDPRALFARALELEDSQAQGSPLTPAQASWLASYQTTPDYQSWKDAVTRNGREILGQ